MQACRWCWALLVVCGWCCWALDIGCLCCHQSSVAVGFRSLLFIVVHHCASFVSVVIVRRHFVLCGDVAADMSGGLPIVEG